jgi:putative glutamine amidotransferase
MTFCKILKTLYFLFLIACGVNRAAEPHHPLIGITADFEMSASDTVGRVTTQMSYVNAVLESGGTPVVLPPVRSADAVNDYLERLDGLVLVGGQDVWPSFYGEKPHPSVDTLSEKRFKFESKLIRAWLEKTDKPILGICLGCQFTNAVCGGTLIQDIPSEVKDALPHRGAEHSVTINKESRLYKILGQEQVTVNSYHHQAVEQVGDNLVVVVRAADGIIEALELPGDRFAVFVQWHPERMAEEHRRIIFGALVDACH